MNNMKKLDYLPFYLFIFVFAIIGIWGIFFTKEASDFDSKTQAYHIEVEKDWDYDHGNKYKPTFYFKANGKEYQCKVNSYSNQYPTLEKGTIYYQSNNPTDCVTEYEIGDDKFVGIGFLVFSLLFFIAITNERRKQKRLNQEPNIENKRLIDEIREAISNIPNENVLIYKRCLITLVLFFLVILIIIDVLNLRTTLISKDFIETTATYVETKEKFTNDAGTECIYTFKDKNGTKQDIVVIVDKNCENEIKIKYDENNLQNYYTESALLNSKEMFWFILKIAAVIPLTILLFSEKLLNKFICGKKNI